MCEKTAHANPRYARGRPRLSHSAGFGGEMKSGTAGAAIHWDVHTDRLSLAEGRAFFSQKKAVMGGFNNKEGSLIYTGDREAVMAETVDIVRKAGPTGLIISSDCSLLETIDHRRVHWVAEALDSLISQEHT